MYQSDSNKTRKHMISIGNYKLIWIYLRYILSIYGRSICGRVVCVKLAKKTGYWPGKKNEDKVQVLIKVPESLLQEFDKAIESSGLTRTDILKQCMIDLIKAHKEK